MYISGDQSVSWDALIKLIVLSQLLPEGMQLRHSVHTADRFCRPPKGQHVPVLVTKEGYDTTGSTNRWTASFEGANFLGKMPVSLHSLVDAGVKANDIACGIGIPAERLVQELTESDWVGISIEDGNLAAHGLPVQQLNSALKNFANPLRQNMLSTLPVGLHETAEEAFYASWGKWGRYTTKGCTWEYASLDILRQNLLAHNIGGHVRLTTSVDEFAGKPSRFFELFVEHYEAAWTAYNQAATSGGEDIRPLHKGDVPFYALVALERGIYRVDFPPYQPGDTIVTLMERFETQHGKPIAVLGKAIPHIIELLMDGNMILPEGGSVYWPQAAKFARAFEGRIGRSLGLHKLYSLRLHALDALRDVGVVFSLPEYLRQSFGCQETTGVYFAEHWRRVISDAKVKLSLLSGKLNLEMLPILMNGGVISEADCSLVGELNSRVQTVDEAVKVLFKEASTCPCEKHERKLFMEHAKQVADKLRGANGYSTYTAALKAAMSTIDYARAREVSRLLAVIQLGYWDNRPFAHWVLAVPGWLDAIKARAELVEQPFV